MGLRDFFRKRDAPMTEAELDERSQVDGIRYRDLQVVAQLVEMGVDLEAPRELVFYSYFVEEAGARAYAAAVVPIGMQEEVSPMDPELLAERPDITDRWSVVHRSFDHAIIPDFLRDTIDALGEAAAAAGGTYDGWEAGLTEAESEALQ